VAAYDNLHRRVCIWIRIFVWCMKLM